MPVLNNQLVGDAYPTATGKGAILSNVYNSQGGWFSVLNATAFVQLEYGGQGDTHWTEEVLLGNGAFVVLPKNCTGVQFRNGVSGLNASVTAQIAQGNEPPLGVSAIGTVTVTAGSLNFQHNTVLVGVEPTLDFDDAAGGTSLVWSVVDDGANTRVRLTPTWASPTIFPNVTGTGAASLAVGAAVGTALGTTGTHASSVGSTATNCFTATVAADTTGFRWTVTGDGGLHWGPGNGALDTVTGRLAAGVLGSTTTALSTGPTSSGPGGSGQNGVFLTGGGGTAMSVASAAATPSWSTSVTNDTQVRWRVTGDGTTSWGPGNSAQDLTLARQVSSPTGAGSFLELTAGAGLGYGTGTGGTATIATGGSATINKPTGKVTASALVATGATGSYTVTNSVVGADDCVVVNIVTGGGNLQTAFVKVGSGTFTIDYTNNSGVNQTPVFTYAVIKGAVA